MTFMRLLPALLMLAAPGMALAQNPTYESGTSAASTLAKWLSPGRLGGVGDLAGDALGRGVNPFAVQDALGLGLCTNSAASSGAHNRLCIGHDASGNGLVTLDSYGGYADKLLKFRVNGVEFLPGSFTVPTAALLSGGGGALTAVSVGPLLQLIGGTLSGIGMSRDASDATLPTARTNLGLTVALRGTGIDPTGATSSAAAAQTIVNTACAAVPVKSIYVPPGTYTFGDKVTQPANCAGLTVFAEPGAVTFKAGAGNSTTTAQIWSNPGNDNLTFDGVVFDGNAANVTNTVALIDVTAPTRGFTLRNSRIQNTHGNGVAIVGENGLSGALSITAAAGQPDLTWTTRPAGIVPGSHIMPNGLIDPDMYVVSVTGTTATLNRNLPDTVLANTTVKFTPGFALSADAVYGATTLPTASTANLSVGQTVYAPSLPNCIQAHTRITGVNPGVSVGIDKALTCKMASGTTLSAIKANASVTLLNNHFSNIGQPMQTAGSASYATVGIQSSGVSTLVLACNTGNCSRAGIVPGQKTGDSPPAGVPANTLVVDGPVIDTGAGTHTVTLASPLTGDVANGTSIPFKVSATSVGYGLWHSFGAPFANIDNHIINNRFENIWLAPLFLSGIGPSVLQGNAYVMNGREYVDPVIAPSPCMLLTGSNGVRVIGEDCSGATGAGLEASRPINLTVTGGVYRENGTTGISVCGGKNVSIGGGAISKNNGQWKNRPYIQDYTTLSRDDKGIKLSGSCTFSQAGSATNISVDNVVVSDDQATPTQIYGIGRYNTTATFSQLRVGASVTGSGNATALTDPALATQAIGTGVSGTLNIKAPSAAGTDVITLPAGTTDFTATGGAGHVVKQNSAGSALTVGAISALPGAVTLPGSGQLSAAGWLGINATPTAQLQVTGGQSATSWSTGALSFPSITGIVGRFGGSTYTDTSSSGTVEHSGLISIGGGTVAASSAVTYKAFPTALIVAPVAGTNVTITDPYALALATSTDGALTKPLLVANTGNTDGTEARIDFQAGTSASFHTVTGGISNRRTSTNDRGLAFWVYNGSLIEGAALDGTGKLSAVGRITALRDTAIPAGGTAGAGLQFSSTANFGVFFGSGAPTLSAAKGSLYLRSDGSATNDRAYINTDGGTTWTPLTTGS